MLIALIKRRTYNSCGIRFELLSATTRQAFPASELALEQVH